MQWRTLARSVGSKTYEPVDGSHGSLGAAAGPPRKGGRRRLGPIVYCFIS